MENKETTVLTIQEVAKRLSLSDFSAKTMCEESGVNYYTYFKAVKVGNTSQRILQALTVWVHNNIKCEE